MSCYYYYFMKIIKKILSDRNTCTVLLLYCLHGDIVHIVTVTIIDIVTEEKPAHKNTEFQEYKIEVQALNTTAIASGYAGRDPQGGTSDGCFL